MLAGKWCNLGDVALQDALEAAFTSGSDGYQFKARGYTYDIDFGRMKQVNATTKRERNLRRVPVASVATAAAVPAVRPSVPRTVAPKFLAVPPGATRAGSLILHPGTAAPAAVAASKTTAPVASVKSVAPKKTSLAPAKTVAPKTTAPAAPVTSSCQGDLCDNCVDQGNLSGNCPSACGASTTCGAHYIEVNIEAASSSSRQSQDIFQGEGLWLHHA